MHAMQTTIATTIGSSPGSLAFARDMFFESAADYQLAGHYACLWISCQMIIYNVPIGSDVRMTKLWDNKFWRSTRPTKLGVRMEGPSTIEIVHVNGNLTTLLGQRDYWAHLHTQRSVVLLIIPYTPVKTILSMDCIWGFHFLPLILFLHLTFEWVVGGAFLDPVSVCSSMAE